MYEISVIVADILYNIGDNAPIFINIGVLHRYSVICSQVIFCFTADTERLAAIFGSGDPDSEVSPTRKRKRNARDVMKDHLRAPQVRALASNLHDRNLNFQ